MRTSLPSHPGETEGRHVVDILKLGTQVRFELNLNPISAYRIFSVLTPSATSSPSLLFAFVRILHLG